MNGIIGKQVSYTSPLITSPIRLGAGSMYKYLDAYSLIKGNKKVEKNNINLAHTG